MPKIYTESERKVIYDFYVIRHDLSVSEICKNLTSFNIHIKTKTLHWLMENWEWTILRRLAKYQKIIYPYHERLKWKSLPNKVLSKVSKDAIKKINQEKKKLRDNRKYRNGLKNGELVEVVEVIDITNNGKQDFKAVSEVTKINDENNNKSTNKSTLLPQLSGQNSGLVPEIVKSDLIGFTMQEESAYLKLTEDMFDYQKLGHSIDRLMRDIKWTDENGVEKNLTSAYRKVMSQLDKDLLIQERNWLIQKRSEDALTEQAEAERRNINLKYAYVNQGLQDEYLYEQGQVRMVDFKDIKTKENAQGVVLWDDEDEDGKRFMNKHTGKKIESKPARMTSKHLAVMGMLKPQINATQINIAQTPIERPSAQPKTQDTSTKSIEQLEKEIAQDSELIEIIKHSASKMDTSKLDDCDSNCAKCVKKLVCEESTLRGGMYQDKEL